MQKIMGQMRRAIKEYNMIEDGDHIAVGVSGGKDSLTLLIGLARLQPIIKANFKITAITLDPGFSPNTETYDEIVDVCKRYGINFVLKQTEIAKIIFDIRQESNPCSLCARMRRGALHDIAKEHGCNKIALGHHYDDAVETFIMNLFNEGRIGCFSPVTYLSRKDITMIRPLVLTEEKDIKRVVKKENYRIVKSPCPIDGHTEREWTKTFIRELAKTRKDIKKLLFGAMRRSHISGW